MGDISREQLGEWLSAYLDGEVNEQQRALIERLLRDDAAARETYESLRRTVELVGSLPRHSAPASIVEDIRAHAERSELIGEAPSAGLDPGRRRSPLVPLLSMAAVLALTATGVWYAAELTGTHPSALPSVAQAIKKDKDNMLAERQVGPTGDEADASAPPVPKAVLASATFEQKLAGGLGADAVREHAFANETVRLEVTVDNEVERDLMAARLIGKLRRQAARDLGSRDADAGRPTGPFFYEGKPKVNFEQGGQRQVLVRGSRQDVEALMEEMSKATTGRKDFALTAGPLTVRGFPQAQAMMTGLEETPAVTTLAAAARPVGDGLADEPSATRLDTSEGKASEGAGASTGFDELLKVVGLNPDDVKETFANSQSSGAATPAAVTNGPIAVAPPAPVPDGGTSELAGPVPPGDAASRTVEHEETRLADRASTPDVGKPGERLADGDAGKDRALKSEEGESLVSRRMRALGKGRIEPKSDEVTSRRRSAIEPTRVGGTPRVSRPTTGGAAAPGARPDEYVTLVIQVRIADTPSADPPSRAIRRTNKPAKDVSRQ